MTDAALDRRPYRKPGVAKHVEHPAVVAEHVCVEGVDALIPGEARKALQQAGADAVALQGIGDGERRLGTIDRVRISIEAGEGRDPPPGLGDERHGCVIVSRDEHPDPRCVERRHAQKSVIQTLRGERGKKLILGAVGGLSLSLRRHRLFDKLLRADAGNHQALVRFAKLEQELAVLPGAFDLLFR